MEYGRIATYYLSDGREVDIYTTSDGYTAQDAYLHQTCKFDHFPTWEEVSVKWVVH